MLDKLQKFLLVLLIIILGLTVTSLGLSIGGTYGSIPAEELGRDFDANHGTFGEYEPGDVVRISGKMALRMDFTYGVDMFVFSNGGIRTAHFNYELRLEGANFTLVSDQDINFLGCGGVMECEVREGATLLFFNVSAPWVPEHFLVVRSSFPSEGAAYVSASCAMLLSVTGGIIMFSVWMARKGTSWWRLFR